LPGINFSAVSKDDIRDIMEIEVNSFSRPWSYISFLNELLCDHAFIYAARCKKISGREQIIAYICFRIIESEMHILKIAVENTWRRHGVASLLLDNYLKEVSGKKIEAVLLEVRHSNTPAIAFYDKLGFTLIGKRPNYYSNSNGNEDALLMTKVLKEAT